MSVNKVRVLFYDTGTHHRCVKTNAMLTEEELTNPISSFIYDCAKAADVELDHRYFNLPAKTLKSDCWVFDINGGRVDPNYPIEFARTFFVRAAPESTALATSITVHITDGCGIPPTVLAIHDVGDQDFCMDTVAQSVAAIAGQTHPSIHTTFFSLDQRLRDKFYITSGGHKVDDPHKSKVGFRRVFYINAVPPKPKMTARMSCGGLAPKPKPRLPPPRMSSGTCAPRPDFSASHRPRVRHATKIGKVWSKTAKRSRGNGWSRQKARDRRERQFDKTMQQRQRSMRPTTTTDGN